MITKVQLLHATVLIAGIAIGIVAGRPPGITSLSKMSPAGTETPSGARPSSQLPARTNGTRPKRIAAEGSGSTPASSSPGTLDGLRIEISKNPWTVGSREWAAAIQAILASLPLADLPRAAAMLWESRANPLLARRVDLVLQRWAPADPNAALAWALSVPGFESEKRKLVNATISEWARQDPVGAWAKAASLGEGECHIADLIPSLAQAVGRVSPRKAAELVEAIVDPTVQTNAASNLAIVWAGSDPESAVGWALGLQSASVREHALRFAIMGLAKKDLAKACDFGQREPDEGVRRAMMTGICSSVTMVEPASLERMLLDGRLAPEMHGCAALLGGVMAGRSPSKAAAMARTLSPGAVRDSFAAGGVRGAVNPMGGSADFSAAWSLIELIGPGLEREEAMAAYAGARGSKSRNVAADWLNSLPAGADRDAAIGGFAESVVQSDSGLAGQWIAKISDPMLRLETLESAYAKWHRRQPSAADSWLDSNAAISEAEKTAVRAARR